MMLNYNGTKCPNWRWTKCPNGHKERKTNKETNKKTQQQFSKINTKQCQRFEESTNAKSGEKVEYFDCILQSLTTKVYVALFVLLVCFASHLLKSNH